MIADSARRQGFVESSAMWRRLLPLLLLGILHQFLYPGEALLFYAGFSFIVLLPLTLVARQKKRRMIATVAGAILTVVGAPFGGIFV